MDTLDHELYTDITFFNARHPDLLYCFQMLFPPFTIVLIVVYGCSSYYSVKPYARKHMRCSSSWATVTAHAIISLAFTVYVVILDIAALVFRNTAPDYYTANFNALLFHYPGLLLPWDGIALTTIAVVMIVVCCCRKLVPTCLKEKVSEMEFVFLLLFSAGVVPLLCLASHAHYVFIAAITDPFYATGIAIYYGIFYYLHHSILTQTYEGVDHCVPNDHHTSVRVPLEQVNNDESTLVDRDDQQDTVQPDDKCTVHEYAANFNYKAMLSVLLVFFVTICYQILITMFYIFIPINHSVENVPSRLFLILQVASALLVSLLAYKIAFGLRDTPSLSAMSSAIRNFLLQSNKLKKDKHCNVYNKKNWDTLDEEKKFTFLLLSLYDSMNIEAKLQQQPLERVQQQHTSDQRDQQETTFSNT